MKKDLAKYMIMVLVFQLIKTIFLDYLMKLNCRTKGKKKNLLISSYLHNGREDRI